MRIQSSAATRLLRISSCLAVLALAGIAIQRTLAHPAYVHAAESVRVIPFTSVIEDVHYDPSGNAIMRSQQKWAVRSDGATAVEVSDHIGDQRHASRFVQLPSGEKVVENLVIGTRSTTYYEDGSADSWIRTPVSNCFDSLKGTAMTNGQVMKGSETVDGFDTVKITQGQVSWWFAPKYGCAPIRVAIDDGPDGRNEQRLVSLTPGEPDAALFAIPAFLKEVNPSTAEAMALAAYCKPADQQCRQTNPARQKAIDDNYNAHQQR